MINWINHHKTHVTYSPCLWYLQHFHTVLVSSLSSLMTDIRAEGLILILRVSHTDFSHWWSSTILKEFFQIDLVWIPTIVSFSQMEYCFISLKYYSLWYVCDITDHRPFSRSRILPANAIQLLSVSWNRSSLVTYCYSLNHLFFHLTVDRTCLSSIPCGWTTSLLTYAAKTAEGYSGSWSKRCFTSCCGLSKLIENTENSSIVFE